MYGILIILILLFVIYTVGVADAFIETENLVFELDLIKGVNVCRLKVEFSNVVNYWE